MTVRGHRRPHVVPISAPSFPTFPRPRLYRNIAYTFVALVVVVVVGVLWLSSVRAEITIHTQQHAVKWDGAVEVAKTASAGQIPGRVVQSVFEKIQEFSVQAPSAVSSTPTAPSAPAAPSVSTSDDSLLAKGNVRIINKYSKSQTLVKTTRLLTADNKLYRIDRTISVPAGGEVVVGAYADEMGSLYAIGPTKFTIPGLFVDLQKYIYAVSDAAFVATPSTAPIKKPVVASPKPKSTIKPVTGKLVTQQNIDDAQKELTDLVLDQAKKALAAEVEDNRLTESVYFVKVLEKKANVVAGQTADTFLASVKLDVTAVYYPKDDMTTLVRMKLKEKIPEGRELLPLDNASAVYVLESTDTKDEKASIHVTIDAAYRLTADSSVLDKSVVAGKSKDEALTLFRAIDGVDDVSVKLSPSWFSKIPTLKDHIEIKVE